MTTLLIGIATRLFGYLTGSRQVETDQHLHWDRSERTWAERKVAS